MEPKQTEDPRIQRTHAMLLSALTELLHEKTFDEVRVKTSASAPASTAPLFTPTLKTNPPSPVRCASADGGAVFLSQRQKQRLLFRFQRSIYRTLKYFQRNKQVFILLLSDPKNASARQLFQQEFARLLKEHLKGLHPELSARDADLIARFFSLGPALLVAQWLTETPDRPCPGGRRRDYPFGFSMRLPALSRRLLKPG